MKPSAALDSLVSWPHPWAVTRDVALVAFCTWVAVRLLGDMTIGDTAAGMSITALIYVPARIAEGVLILARDDWKKSKAQPKPKAKS